MKRFNKLDQAFRQQEETPWVSLCGTPAFGAWDAKIGVFVETSKSAVASTRLKLTQLPLSLLMAVLWLDATAPTGPKGTSDDLIPHLTPVAEGSVSVEPHGNMQPLESIWILNP